MRIFVDVGAHYGETAKVALNPKWGFDRVYSFEPSEFCRQQIARIRDPRLTVEPVALSNRNEPGTLYGSGLLGGSLYADKRQYEMTADESVPLLRAADWFRKNIPDGATVYLKLNCEGGEADILDDLLDSGEINRIKRLWIDFDIAKVPSQAHRRQGIEARLKQAKVKYTAADGFGFGPQHGIEAWLEWHCRQVPTTLQQRLSYSLPNSPYELAVAVVRTILPQKVFWWLGRRIGRIAMSR